MHCSLLLTLQRRDVCITDLAGDGDRRVSRRVEGGDDRSSQRGLSRRAGLAAAHLSGRGRGRAGRRPLPTGRSGGLLEKPRGENHVRNSV